MKRKRLSWFTHAAKWASRAAGRPITFMIAVAIILLWAITGPIFQFSDTWQLVINTSTTIVTFLMVFLIQNTQNRDTEAMQIKMDELIRAIENAIMLSSTWRNWTMKNLILFEKIIWSWQKKPGRN